MLINHTGTLGIVINAVTENVTGSLFLTLLLIVVFVMALAIISRVPVEVTVILVLPLLLTLMSYTSEFLAIGGVALIYLGVLFIKNFPARS